MNSVTLVGIVGKSSKVTGTGHRSLLRFQLFTYDPDQDAACEMHIVFVRGTPAATLSRQICEGRSVLVRGSLFTQEHAETNKAIRRDTGITAREVELDVAVSSLRMQVCA